ncbi:ribosome silencing factor [Agilicoccus flavus]|uniref:ribosome silencing factor n=1 Tax=Agilicoccus flavus TaxID=2775968 RepID=UPI001CF6C53A|nr:ribosome silencing factor [Agilicoccus flavus]
MTASAGALDLAQRAAGAAEDKLAVDIVALDVTGRFPLSDVFVVATAETERQVGAVVDAVEDALREAGCRLVRREGEKSGRWVLLDFGAIVVHVQHEDERKFYQLERLWKDCPRVPLRLGPGAAPAEPAGADGGEPGDRAHDAEAPAEPGDAAHDDGP